MVLGATQRGAHRRAPLRDDAGSQALEFAMVVPLVVLSVLIVLGAGLLGVDLVTAQGLARDAARTAAVAGAEEARAVVEEAAGRRRVTVDVAPQHPGPGDTVTVSVRLHSPVLSAVGVDVWAPARAAMPVEPR